MKKHDYDYYALGLIAIAVSLGIYLGISSIIKSAFKKESEQTQNIYESRDLIEEQSERAQAVRKRHKLMMEKRNQQIQDIQR